MAGPTLILFYGMALEEEAEAALLQFPQDDTGSFADLIPRVVLGMVQESPLSLSKRGRVPGTFLEVTNYCQALPQDQDGLC